MTIVVAVCLFARYAANDLSLSANVSETAYRNARKGETVLKTAFAACDGAFLDGKRLSQREKGPIGAENGFRRA